MACREISVMPETKVRSCPHYAIVVLLLILSLAIFLRLFKLGQSPPGLNQDEAAGAWNAYCLLKTGTDQHGVSWPIFYLRELGGPTSTLYAYSMIPFQAIGGMNIYTTRLPSVFAGVLSVILIYFTGKRLFNWQTGLIAAAFLAVDPWNLQQSRWGHEAVLGAIAGLLPLAALLWARMPITNDKLQTPLPLRAALAGLLSGIVCYGYAAIRIFVPIFLLAIVAVTLPAWWNHLKNRKGILAVAAWAAGFGAMFGPLAWQHIFHPEGIGSHGYYNMLWTGSEPLTFKIQALLARYIGHFGPGFLFIHGDHFVIQSPPGMGMFYWYMLPLMLIGLAVVIYKFRSSYSARLVLAYAAVYPAGDSFFRSAGMHALRSLPGSCGLVLLAAVGAFFSAQWLLKKSRPIAVSLTILFIIAAAYFNVQYLNRFFGDYNRRSDVYHLYHADLVEALNWLGPRLTDTDMVFCTTDGLNMPYVVSLVVLNYDPHKWFAEPRNFFKAGEWDYYTQYGKMHFIYDFPTFSILDLQKKFALGRILLIVRPDEFTALIEFEKMLRPDEFKIENPFQHIIHRIYGPDNEATLWLCRF